MRKASRSNKRQPEFDPRELDDLILTPAVGSGVGSHLVGGSGEQETLPPAGNVRVAENPNLPTVDTLDLPTVDRSNLAPGPEAAGDARKSFSSSAEILSHINLLQHASEVDRRAESRDKFQPETVDRLKLSRVDDPITPVADSLNLSTVDRFNMTTIGTALDATHDAGVSPDRRSPQPLTPAFWTTENGELVPGSRVKRIRLAQDAINSAEESVYDTLWRARPYADPAADNDSFRLVQAGYDYLAKRTRLSKKTIQRIVARLIAKDFIAIEQPADIYHKSSTVYRVFSYKKVLEKLTEKDRLHAAKIGPGIVFVRSLRRVTGAATATEGGPPTMDTLNLSTVDRLNQTTVDRTTSSTVVKTHPSTVVKMTTNLEQSCLGSSSSSSEQETVRLRSLLAPHVGLIDDDAVHQLLQQCRLRAPDCTPEQIAYFASYKLRWAKQIQNPIGFILTAVPRHFDNRGHEAVRELLHQQARQQLLEWQESYDYWSTIANNPSEPHSQRSQARKILAELDTSRPL